MEKRCNILLGGYRKTVEDLCCDNTDGCANARRALLGSGCLSTFATSVTGGAFFTAILIAMGADNTYIGYVSMATTFCMVMQFFAPLFWERRQARKALILWMEAISHFMTYLGLPLVAILPIETGWKLGLFMGMTLLSGFVQHLSLPASNAWIMQSIPFVKRVSYESFNSTVPVVINVVSSFFAGLLVDGIEGSPSAVGGVSSAMLAILVLRGLAFVAACASTLWKALRVREFPYRMTGGDRVRLSMLLVPMKNRPFLCLSLIPCLWAMIGGIIGNYFMLYLVETVRMPYSLISSAGFISTPIILLVTPIWTQVLRRRDWLRTMAVAILGYCVAYCCNVLISAQTQYFYFLAIIIGHLFSPGITMVGNNLIFVHMPKENRTAYFAFYSLMITAFSFLGQAFGTWFVTMAGSVRFDLLGIAIGNLQMTSALAATFGILLSALILLLGSRLPKNKIEP